MSEPALARTKPAIQKDLQACTHEVQHPQRMTQKHIDENEEMRCPTCNARQTWSDECRRCKCDLSLLRRCRQTGETQRHNCLRMLKEGRLEQALHHARRYASIVGTAEASPLLGTCLLLCGNWPDVYDLLPASPFRSDAWKGLTES